MLCQQEDLVTDRLRLRRPEHADVGVILAVHRHPLACAYNPSDALTGRDGAEVLFMRWDEHWRANGFGYWVVCHGASAEPAGFCGVKFTRLWQRTALNLFYRLDPAFCGHGLATEAALATVAWASAHLPRYPVIARIRPANTASAVVAVRAGLARTSWLDCQGDDGEDAIFAARWPDWSMTALDTYAMGSR